MEFCIGTIWGMKITNHMPFDLIVPFLGISSMGILLHVANFMLNLFQRKEGVYGHITGTHLISSDLES